MRASTILIASGLAVQSAMAFKVYGVEVPETPEDLVLTDIIKHPEESSESVIIIYEDAEPATLAVRALENPHLEKRCGSNKVNCHDDNVATPNQCGELTSFIRSRGQTKINNSPRSVCALSIINGKSSQCCASWHTNVSGAIWNNLLSGINAASIQCKNRFSARISDVKLGSTCTVQCVSNRPDGC